MTNAPNNPTPADKRLGDERSEAHLLELRRRAERGGVAAGGIRPEGAPFPRATPETGYYGIPLLKEPQWKWEVPVYFFVGGAAGSAAVIGATAHLAGVDEEIVRDARWIAAGGALASAGLLVADLGRPARFLNMLRVFKVQSPMSMGAWILAGFGSASAAAALAQWVHDRLPATPIRVLGNVAEAFSAAFALPFSNYTGVLIGATAIPVWSANVKTLPIHFGMSGLNTAVGILELLGHEHRALNRLGILASSYETYEGMVLETKTIPVVDPLKRGTSGWMTRSGGVLSGPAPLVLRFMAEFTGERQSRQLRRWAAYASVAGSLLTRVGWIRAGHASARDHRIPLELAGATPPPLSGDD